LVCGHKQPDARDHIEVDHGRVAGVTDRGQRHHQNEDAMALAVTDRGAAIVVCDGVSTTDNSYEASQAAADAALAILLTTGDEPERAMIAAAAAAQAAVADVPSGGGGLGNPSCTFVAALVDGSDVTVGWLGDSRAYWLGSEPCLLTQDHSWATEMVAAGAMTPEEAARDPRASTITRWLGRDAPDVDPSVAKYSLGQGRLLLCSDGLWHYAPQPETLATNPALTAPTLVDQARGLADFANTAGGHDNITVVLAETAGPTPARRAEV
jgi:serine/threonine protein phosphatase PrpC